MSTPTSRFQDWRGHPWCRFGQRGYAYIFFCDLMAGHDGDHVHNDRAFRPGIRRCTGEILTPRDERKYRRKRLSRIARAQYRASAAGTSP